ncbi:hypothetical protein [Phenylobacterium soli]|uniref:C2H2-type domain-containing protein n=1 Tax=Phenylobacterium soli TaxID=2170551 RepID=A0A328AFN9_9CAUL|nr:hypothetical protein [Phenylobacterium soli]RAK51618.1 hypothetical protein DJ017_17435 [Phenylobacterium soli]
MSGVSDFPRAGWASLTDDQRADIEAHVRGLTVDAETYNAPPHGWTCFHCGETFRTLSGARLHFGAYPSATPLCGAEAIKRAIRTHVRVEWVRNPGGGGGYDFEASTLDEAARAILKASDASRPTDGRPALEEKP